MNTIHTFRALQRKLTSQFASTVKLNVREALNSAMLEEIERDPTVFLMGIDSCVNLNIRRGSWSILRCL